MRKAEALEKETGKRVIHFEKGDFQGDEFYPAPHISEAAIRAVHEGHVRYVPGPGIPDLRDAIAEEATKRGRPTSREEVLVTMGAKHALTQSLLTMVDVGDEVIFPNPGYPPDEFWITYAGGKVVYAPLIEPDFHFDLDSLRSLITPKTKMLIINSPQRPNGMIVGQLEEMAELCLEHNVVVLTDEIFSHMVYPPAEHKTITAVPGMADQSILVDTFSKTYIMTGFRIGWCVANKELITAMDIFQQNSVQRAGLRPDRRPGRDHGSPGPRARADRAPAGQARQGRRGPGRDRWHRVPSARRVVLRVPGHPGDGHDRSAVRGLPHRAVPGRCRRGYRFR